MSSTNFERIKQWFEQLADLMPEQRLAFLREAQGIDEDTRRQLIDLLAMDDQLVGSTARPALLRAATDTTDEDMLGRAIGPYVIVKALGRGGMGRVFLADRADGSITQQVAIKIVRPELLDAHTIARFHLERQVLALLKHPHIATLMDAGELEAGSPYVVMEYVEGQAITDYASTHRLGVRDRLQLFLKVCDAVAFAHRNLIVHRDLKPGNVLVTADAQPKLLDFGIAKPLLGAIGTIDVQDTSAAQRFFSPHNAAPEQLRNEPITPACDVYGLGVLLYQLLTGNKPLDMSGLTPGEMEQRILHEDPRPPSQNVATESLVGAAAGRDAKPPHSEQSRSASAPADVGFSAKALKGDLDAIALKCLRKSPQDRYMTVDQLAADLQAHLQGFPVAARRGGGAYRLRRFVGRHRLAVASSTAILIVATFGALTWLRQYRATLEQQSRADQMTSLIMDALNATDPAQALGKDVSAREVFERIATQARLDSAGGTEAAPLLVPIAEIHRLIGEPERALALQADIKVQSLGDAPRSLYWSTRSHALAETGSFDEARAAQTELLRLAGDDEARQAARLASAAIEFQAGEPGKSVSIIEDVVAAPLSPALSIRARTLLAQGYRVTGKPERSEQILEQLLAEARNGGSLDSPQALEQANLLAGLKADLQKFDQATALANQAMATAERLYGVQSLRYAQAKNAKFRVLTAIGDMTAAKVLATELLDTYVGVLGRAHPTTARAHFNLAGIQNDQGEFAVADQNYQAAIDIAEQVWPTSNVTTQLFRTGYATELAARGEWARAAVLAEDVIRVAEEHQIIQQYDIYPIDLLIVAADLYRQQPTTGQYAKVLGTLEEAKKSPNPLAQKAVAKIVEGMVGLGVRER